jgi:hypothetical protein
MRLLTNISKARYAQGMRGEKAGFERLLSVMPEGWEGKAKGPGAFAHGREIKSAVDLPRLVFLYLTEGKSFSGAAALLRLGAMCSISKKAVFTRFQRCGEWLWWLWENLYRNNKAIGEAPAWLGDRKVYLVDSSDEPVHGSDKADYRQQYALGLFDLGMKEKEMTATEQGEKAGTFKSFGEKDIVIGDRAYCGTQGLNREEAGNGRSAMNTKGSTTRSVSVWYEKPKRLRSGALKP